MSPIFSIGLFFLGLGILLIIFPHLLQIIVALLLIFIGVSLMSMDRARKNGKKIVWFQYRQ